LRRIYFFIFLLLSATIGRGQLKRFSFAENKMASPFTIIMYAEDSAKAKSLSVQCFIAVDSLVNIFSDYNPDSELNRLCATAGTETSFQCSPALFDILRMSSEAYKKSEGTFDITIGPLSRLWRESRRSKTFPDSALIEEKRQLIGFDKIKIERASRTAMLLKKGMQLDLGGIAQGYIAQCVIDFLKSQKIRNALVDVSGDIVCIGEPPGTDGWTIAVSLPANDSKQLQRRIVVTNNAVTTSGDTFQFFEHNGKRYSHVIDPSTGYGITSQRNVTVIAKDGTLADWLTKACGLLPISKAKKLAREMNAALLIVEKRKSKMNFYSSKKFRHFWKKR
jgi:thiamine biosynthesis lipoprotein